MPETFPHNEFIVANPTYYRIQAILRDLVITYLADLPPGLTT